MKKKQCKFLKKDRQKHTGKKLCICLMILFTLVMAADIANLFLTPAQVAEISFTPGGFDRGDGSAFPERPESGERPGGDFQMPEGGDFRMPEGGFENGEAPEDRGERPSREGRSDRNSGRRQRSFLQSVRSVWLPILIVCILGDALCLIFLRRLRRKETSSVQVVGMPLLEEPDSDEPLRRGRGPWGAILCLVTAFAIILAMLPTEDTDGSSVNVRSQVISGIAEAAEIQTVLSGAGTLEADTLTPVTVPQQVTVLSYHVRNGETVAAGDSLVSVDKTSASSAMLDLSEVLADLDADLEAARQTSNSCYINATAAGRVKKIYAKAGDMVTDVLYQYGALMLLSLDGTMKVTFDSTESLTVGDTVTVQHSGGRDEGRILSVREGKITVTLSDEKAPYGAQASILDANGKTMGQGSLEISSALKVIGYYGKVDAISVSVGSKVSVGSSLLTLKETGDTTDYQILLARRNELEAQMQKLSQLARTGMVAAENDGIVSGVPEDAEIELLSANGSVEENTLATSGGSWQLVLLSNFEEDSGEKDGTRKGNWFDHFFPEKGEVDDEKDPDNEDTDEDGSGDDAGDGEQTALSGNYAAKFEDISENEYTLKLRVLSDTAIESDTDLTALDFEGVSLKDYFYDSSLSDKEFDVTDNSGTGTAGSESGTEGETATASDSSGTTVSESNKIKLSGLKEGDLLRLEFTEDEVTDILEVVRPGTGGGSGDAGGEDKEPSGGGDPGEMSGGRPSGSGSMDGSMPSGSGTAVQKSYDRYISEQTELLYVSDQEEIAVTISVDELDILSLERNLKAQITLDAMKGQSFTGHIARISSEGTNDGGNTKFAVTVLLPREASMLDGMNASVKVVTATSTAAVSIPAAALVEADGKTCVYTTYDPELDTLGGLTEVETGTSDGERVEILSGLEAGDPFHYRYADTVTYSFLRSL